MAYHHLVTNVTPDGHRTQKGLRMLSSEIISFRRRMDVRPICPLRLLRNETARFLENLHQRQNILQLGPLCLLLPPEIRGQAFVLYIPSSTINTTDDA